MAVGLARVGVNQLPVAPADTDFTAKFLSRVANPTSFDVLFEYLPDILFSQIALRTGFYDQSQLTNRFARRHRVPPSQYRVVHARPMPNQVARLQEHARGSSNEMSAKCMAPAGVQS
jgi:hypothetical protein